MAVLNGLSLAKFAQLDLVIVDVQVQLDCFLASIRLPAICDPVISATDMRHLIRITACTFNHFLYMIQF